MIDVKLSVIVPVYNAEATLKKCLDSIIVQGIPGMELIIVDDGSTDNSNSIEEYYSSTYPGFVQLHKKENGGVASARNVGVQIAKGDYVTFVDSDDTLKEGYYRDFLTAFDKVDVTPDIAVSGVTILENEMEKESHVGLASLVTREEFAKNFFVMNRDTNLRAVWNKLFKREIIKDIRFRKRIVAEDQIYCLEAYAKINNIMFVDTCGYVYWINPHSITHRLKNNYDEIHELSASMKYRAQTWLLYRNIGITDEVIYEEHCRMDYVWFYTMVKNIMNPGTPYIEKKAQLKQIRAIMDEKDPRDCILHSTGKSKLAHLVKIMYMIDSPRLTRVLLCRI